MYLFGPHEQKMLYSVSHSGHVLFVAEVAHIDIHGRAGLVRFRIVNQEHLQLIRQPYHAVLPIIQGRGLQAVREPLDRPMSMLSQGAVESSRRLRLR